LSAGRRRQSGGDVFLRASFLKMRAFWSVKMEKTTPLIIGVGVIIGALALTLAYFGNPPNMGVCVACFLRDTAGALKLQQAAPVQYLRPEILGFVLGAFGAVLAFRQYRPTAGSSPFLRLVLGFFMMAGCLVFLGCPLRMVLRIAGGDLNAVVGFAGFFVGIAIGVWFLKREFALTPNTSQRKIEGMIFPILCLVLLGMALFQSGLFGQSVKGPGAQHAPFAIALAAGLVIGALVQRTRFCFIGMISHIFLFKRFSMLLGVVALTAVVFVGNLALGNVNPGFDGQPIAHTDGVWNFTAMALVGLCGAFLGGCPLRQVVGAGQGGSDNAMTVIGMLLGAAAALNFGFAASGAGVPLAGKVVVVVGLLTALTVGLVFSKLRK
jgi:YedE family putative selenium metabolism protein